MDDKLDLGQAYAPPVASPPATALPDVVSPYDKVVRLSFPIGAVVGLVGGCLVSFEYAYALSYFHAEKIAPSITCFIVLRSVGPSCAVLAAALTAVVLLHRAGRRASGPVTIDHTRAYLVMASFPLLFVVTAPFCLLGALLMWLAAFSGTTSQFVTSLPQSVKGIDFVCGLAVAAGCGLWLTGLLRIGANWLTTKKHGLALKLFVAYAALAIPNAGLRAVLSLVDPD
ncbi:hypothetical protein [Polyangium jinanense]|uniref:Uncharacterized protein n=1 Tax=Polyangium jinanense TaxID=2829994 RepID=A0A9X3X6M1_9BACT|nr:hypothetical protein [Polyangium jinanense]MDC3955819.1 hypothetical protein [Polyangium jinanense]MDC3983178.1 hypothetical protein [Polyangium jinanense]